MISSLTVFVDLKAWDIRDVEARGDDWPTVNDILKASIVPANVQVIADMHKNLPGSSKVIWMIDGMNELRSELSAKVLEALTNELRGTVRSRLIVADRSDSRYKGADWRVRLVNPLDSAVVEQHVPIVELVTEEDKRRRELLRSPFFLDVAITNEGLTWRSSVQAIHGLFASRVKLNELEIDVLSAYALSVYEAKAGLAFELDDMVRAVGSPIAKRLIESRLVQPVTGTKVSFYHQLLHDYLSSRSVAQRPETWVPRYFDALSFDANTYESVFMVLDQLGSEDAFARYITALYDWNWFATIRCVERALSDGWAVPHHLKLMLSAMLCEKRFDPVAGSRARADSWSSKLDAVTGFGFARVTTIPGLVAEVEQFRKGSEPSWFQDWYKLFALIGTPSHVPSENEIALLASPNPFIGWIAAQVTRHCNLTDEGARQIRAIYSGARHATDDVSCSIRWRAVHAVGRNPSSDNARMLLSAIDGDSYSWVKYGAVRSLLEMAAISEEADSLKFLSEVGARLSKLPQEALAQVAWATRYEGTTAGWASRALPLLEAAYELQETDKEREQWQNRMEAFKAWAARETS
ncbi:hypothetical protein RB614_20230 [Phytohabitans sp. ZYX-F-186]|uniref:KAP NTPase domain-containing protein n=1 Tax=Phytohabitans maris TaxID=3071409 RepID=A0ABU0ZK06_9ACTN|nr:hypothetical protein [Phytohabitans sp. ZYX-F-186]MDQ7906846.1 hypothetical protein [Phytohabitans sp. ZYX-F-186]